MTQSDKELLLKDLCARLPYGVKISIPELWIKENRVEILYEIFKGDDGLYRANGSGMLIEYIKPYLFPMSSMTEEQEKEYKETTIGTGIFTVWTTNTYDWFIKNHFDYRGLIEKGLAIDATNLNIY